MKRTWKTVFMALLTGCAGAWAGTLVVGTPEVDGNEVTVPVLYEGVQEGASAMDFRLNYDPDVFSPAGVGPGSSASAANKQVQSNVIKDGELVVIAMGMNQTEFQPGEVARITLRRIGEGSASESNVSITNTTLASAEGLELPSQGSAGTIKLSAYTGADDVPVDDGSDAGSDNGALPGTDDRRASPDVSPPSNDSQDDMQVAQNETAANEPAPTPTVSVPVSESGSSSGRQAAAASGALPVGATTESQGTARADTGSSLSQLAAATKTARDLRESIPTPPDRPAGSAPGQDSPAPSPSDDSPDKSAAGASPETAAPDGESSESPADAQDMTMARAQPSDIADPPQAPRAAQGDDSPSESEVAETPKQSPIKLILFGVLAAVLVAVFLVRRRLFS
jgi:hypothetical protein